MFTGLVEEIGVVKSVARGSGGYQLRVAARTVLEDTREGDSIAVNGVCLTATAFDADSFTVGLAPETLSKTDLGDLKPGDMINLERAALPTTRLGGHYVQGHVDGTGIIRNFRPDNDALWLTIAAPDALMRYIVPKGYIAVDGASLTVVNTGPGWFDVTLIAYSQGKLILPRKNPGDRVNLEVDILAKYVERLLPDVSSRTQRSVERCAADPRPRAENSARPDGGPGSNKRSPAASHPDACNGRDDTGRVTKELLAAHGFINEGAR